MEGFIKFITNPDWWGAIATIVAAIVAAVITYVLGKRQNKLQEQQVKLQEQQNKLQEVQIKQQEYDLYRRMYSQVYESDFFNKTILLRIVALLTRNEDNGFRLRLIEDIYKECEMCSEKFTECTIDMELKQCGECCDINCYFAALQESRRVLIMFKYFAENDLLAYDASEIYNVPMDSHIPFEKLIDIIIKLYKGENSSVLRNKLMAYASVVEATNQSQLLKTIKQRIISNDKK